jgi:hypothetical protein
VNVAGAHLALDIERLLETTPQALRLIADAGIAVRAFASERANLESVFLTLTGRSLRDE